MQFNIPNIATLHAGIAGCGREKALTMRLQLHRRWFLTLISTSAFLMAVACAPASTSNTRTAALQPFTQAENHDSVAMLIIKKQDNEKTITIRRGDTIQIELERSGGTGYEWYLDQNYKAYFDLLKQGSEEIAGQGLVGGPVITRWQLKAVRQGDAELKLFLYRNWEDKDKAASLFAVKVKIL